MNRSVRVALIACGMLWPVVAQAQTEQRIWAVLPDLNPDRCTIVAARTAMGGEPTEDTFRWRADADEDLELAFRFSRKEAVFLDLPEPGSKAVVTVDIPIGNDSFRLVDQEVSVSSIERGGTMLAFVMPKDFTEFLGQGSSLNIVYQGSRVYTLNLKGSLHVMDDLEACIHTLLPWMKQNAR